MKLIDGQDYTPDPNYTTIFERCQLCGNVTPYETKTNDEAYTRLKVSREGLVSNMVKHCFNSECQTLQIPVGYVMRDNPEADRIAGQKENTR